MLDNLSYMKEFKPFSKKRRSFALDVKSKLFFNNSKCIHHKRSIYEYIKVVPTAEFRNILKIATHYFSLVDCEVSNNFTEKASFALTTTYIAEIEKAFHCISRVLIKSLYKESKAIFNSSISVCSTKSEEVIKVRTPDQAAVFVLDSKAVKCL